MKITTTAIPTPLSDLVIKKRLKKLSPEACQLLMLIVIAYEPLGKTVLEKMADGLGIFKGGYKGKKDAYIQALLDIENTDFIELNNKTMAECHEHYIDSLMRLFSTDKSFAQFSKAVQHKRPLVENSQWYQSFKGFKRAVRDARIFIYLGNMEAYYNLLEDSDSQYSYNWRSYDLFSKIFKSDESWVWLRTAGVELRCSAYFSVVSKAIYFLDSAESIMDDLTAAIKDHGEEIMSSGLVSVVAAWAEYKCLRGNFKEVFVILDNPAYSKHNLAMYFSAWFLTAQGEYAAAVADFEAFRQFMRKNKIKEAELPDYAVIYSYCAVFSQNSTALTKKMIAPLKKRTNNADSGSPLLAAAYMMTGDRSKADSTFTDVYDMQSTFDALYFQSLVSYWYYGDNLRENRQALIKLYKKAKAEGFVYVEFELAALLAEIEPDYIQIEQDLSERHNFKSLKHAITKAEDWSIALDLLDAVVGEKTKTATISGDSRLVWFVEFYGKNEIGQISVKEQKRAKNGSWTKGRAVAMKRLVNDEVDCMTEYDRKVSTVISFSNNYYYGSGEYSIDVDKALVKLVGHPLVFDVDNPNTRIELVAGEPELVVEKNKKGNMTVSFAEEFTEIGVLLVRETPTRYKVIAITQKHLSILEAFGSKKLVIPEEGKERLLSVLPKLSDIVTVHSDIVGTDTQAEQVDASAQIIVHLLPNGDGVRIEPFVRPFETSGPYFKPGTGAENVYASIDDKNKVAKRDLKQEKKELKKLLNLSPTLKEFDENSGVWNLDNPFHGLSALEELNAVKDTISIEWPEGEKMRIIRSVSASDMKVKIEKENDWFGISGSVKIDDKKVLDMRQLIDLFEASGSRFVQVSDGQFVAFTEQFRNNLLELGGIGERRVNDIKLHPLAIPAVDEFMSAFDDIKVDREWTEQLKKIESLSSFKPRLPRTLQAELRDYQRDGYNWLQTLAEWGVGACLADDMGLGKTIQALAVILKRSSEGPALVVAPASVCLNWVKEARKFAPTLNPIVFGGGERKEMMKNLKPRDLVVCSFGLLPSEEELLSAQVWSTVVLDEAQAIKNANTKRSKAAHKLQAGFKVLTTGTPVENHLGELWNLMRFINPGLLGSWKIFNERFATPIEKNGDSHARKQLKKLIQPFILRRNKSAVLDELPEKTEITLNVELSDDERALYESLRRKAVESMAESAQDVGAGQQHLMILAEITRLRQVCCHPKLVIKDSGLESSKLKLLLETVNELRENNHRALIFSQFVGHLKLIREQLDKQGISYQYLDGSTPKKKRQQAVDDFQDGEGELFLISLKAGGTGLNLTAADYVIHMDPWWNPAVEDQASDRVHRIGQTRPVTVYRLVTKDTIEEKIVKLHASKRDLADSLLSGTETSGKLSSKDLLALIRH